jgi:ubiquitin-protein ligase
MAITSNSLSASGRKRLAQEFEMLKKEEKDLGITFNLLKKQDGSEDLDVWEIKINGAPQTLYEGFVLCAKMVFPYQYPFSPPSFEFTHDMFHPNIYKDGRIFISILHTESDDIIDAESVSCSWTPGQNIRTVCLSIVSLLDSPNIFSPANVDASKLYRDDKNGYKNEVLKKLEQICQKVV